MNELVATSKSTRYFSRRQAAVGALISGPLAFAFMTDRNLVALGMSRLRPIALAIAVVGVPVWLALGWYLSRDLGLLAGVAFGVAGWLAYGPLGGDDALNHISDGAPTFSWWGAAAVIFGAKALQFAAVFVLGVIIGDA